MAANQVNLVERALAHLPAERRFDPAEIHRIAAWLAASRGDRESERRELERLVGLDPADLDTLWTGSLG